MSNPHTADAAGGEAIYSSDGLSPLPIPPPPISSTTSTKTTTNDNDNHTTTMLLVDSLDNESKDVIQAFEVFAGKVFHNTNHTTGVSSSTTSSNIIARRGDTNETKLEKLARIQAELQTLEEEHGCNKKDGNDIDDDENEVMNVMNVMNELSNRLKYLQSNVYTKDSITLRQQDLTSYVQNLTIDETSSHTENGGNTTITNDTNSSDIGKNHSGMTPEQRLLRIEQFLGSQINNYSGGGSMLERLKEAEDKLNSIDEKTLNYAASRAKVIR